MKCAWYMTIAAGFFILLLACAGDQTQGDTEQAEVQPEPARTEELVAHTTESGLHYVILKEGSGPNPRASDRVTVHYRGTLRDGTEFDSSYKRGQPATFSLLGVIPGWTEGLQLMSVGSKYRFTIPPELAYGAEGRAPVIGPNETLIFEVELLDIVGGP